MIESKAWAEVIYPKISPFYPERLVKIGFLQMVAWTGVRTAASGCTRPVSGGFI